MTDRKPSDGPLTVIAVTTEDDRHPDTRAEAMSRARDAHATLILYDLDAGRSPLESPLPTEWDSEGEEEAVGDRLSPDELDAAGRATIAEQVRLARAEGIDAWGWLPDAADREALIAYAAGQPRPLIVVPESEPELADSELPGTVITHGGATRRRESGG
jgi:hypothetical protein